MKDIVGNFAGYIPSCETGRAFKDEEWSKKTMIFAEIVYILPNGYKEKNSKNVDEIKGEMNSFNEDVKKYSNQFSGFILIQFQASFISL